MRVEAVIDEGLGNASYMVDVGDGLALVIDPARDPRRYLDAAAKSGLRIAYAAETHLHADFVSGGRELQALGAELLAPAGADLAFDHRPLRDGEELDLGGLMLRVIATPGHTPEHVAYLLSDGGRALAVFTGGALLRGSVARTDLLGPEQTEPLAREMFHSLHDRLFTLPDDVSVFPTHGAGASFCAAAPADDDADASTTIGDERVGNRLAAIDDEQVFVDELVGSYGSYPGYFLTLRDVNRSGSRVYGSTMPDLPRLPLEIFREATARGAELIDVRPGGEFAAGHVPGSLSIELRPAFATWLGWLVDRERPLVFVASQGQDRSELVRQCLAIGFERIVGELDGGLDAWRDAAQPIGSFLVVEADRTAEGRFLDVRQDSEFEAGHIPDAVHVELGSLAAAASAVPAEPLTVHCGHGERAVTAASLLERAGRHPLTVMWGGPDDWGRAHGETLALGSLGRR